MKTGVWIDTVQSLFETKAIVLMEDGNVITLPTYRITGINYKLLNDKD